jgi:hypothetical protein
MDPVSRLQLARDEINKLFGVGFAEQHPEVVVVVVQSSDWAATRLAVAIERVAEALLVEEETQQRIVPAHRQIRTLRARVRASWGLSGWCPLERYRSPEARARDKPTVSPSGRSFATSTRANH